MARSPSAQDMSGGDFRRRSWIASRDLPGELDAGDITQ